ncbi:MAG: hypothetical protein KDD04_10535, partial [Sinomicrobium sp.]|nr:hypothetical protein [Sinomicrobium sp.]
MTLILVFSACQKDPLPAGADEAQRREIIRVSEQQIANAQQEFTKMEARILRQTPVNAVTLPAGSTDGLAAAVAEAGRGGTILVKAGEHLETGTVTITEKVTIIGEKGAVIFSGTEGVNVAGRLQPALYIKGATGVVIYGLDLRADSYLGGIGILVHNAPKTVISQNSITGFSGGI